jgi:hypothetical protein
MLRTAMQAPQQRPQVRFECHVALRTTQPPRFLEVFQFEPAVWARTTDLAGIPDSTHLGQKIREGHVPRTHARLQTLLLCALLTQMRARDLVVLDLREVQNRFVFAAVLANHSIRLGKSSATVLP